MVVMAAYAPLFCKKGFNKWDANLIWFDNRGMWRTCNYWYQQLFSVSGDRAFAASEAMDGRRADDKVFTSPTVDSATGEIFFKFVNAEALDKLFTVKVRGGAAYVATLEFITSHDTAVKNQGDQNYYAKEYAEAVVPQVRDLGTVRRRFAFTMPENSLGILRLKPVK